MDVEVVRRWGDSGVGPSRKRDLRRDNCGFGGREGVGEGGAEEAKGSERGGDEMDARCRISSPMPPGSQFLHAGGRRFNLRGPEDCRCLRRAMPPAPRAGNFYTDFF